MDSFEINKIVAAVLMVALLVIGIGKLSNVIFHVEKPKTPGYAVEVEQATTVSSSTKKVVEEKVHLKINVKFKKNWTDNEEHYENMGLNFLDNKEN